MMYSVFKQILLFTTIIALCLTTNTTAYANERVTLAEQKLAELEKASGGRLGVSALNTANGSYIRYRADERFPFCSTFKALLVAAVLKQSMDDSRIMQQHVSYAKDDLIIWSPATEKHLSNGMSVAELCAAAIQFSDNTAANLLLQTLGGPEALNSFTRSIGDSAFRLDRWEPDLNSAMPGDPRDTSTPDAMQKSLKRLVLGDMLAPPQREQLQAWLKGNTTGAQSIRAGVPEGWTVGDKTGGGYYGTTNDIALIWPPDGAPIVLAVYFTQKEKDAPARKDVIAAAARLVVEGLQ